MPPFAVVAPPARPRPQRILSLGFRLVVLVILFGVLFVIGALPLGGLMPEGASEPGVVSPEAGLLLYSLAHVLILAALILTSRWRGWKLAAAVAVAYYGTVTFVTQIESWYFLSSITVGADILPWLFVMGMPAALVFVPIAVWTLGRGGRNPAPAPHFQAMSAGEWASKLAVLAAAYIILYWTAGYFIAWQNPELRAFYGSPGEPLPFLEHTVATLQEDPWLFPFQALRAMVWTFCGFIIVLGSVVGRWQTALLVGLLFSVPQNIGHILENPLIPHASVRLSHMIETASSTFVFGMLVGWLLYRRSEK